MLAAIIHARRGNIGVPYPVLDLFQIRVVLERMHGAMRPGALLFAGHSENFSQARTLFRLRGKTVYERL